LNISLHFKQAVLEFCLSWATLTSLHGEAWLLPIEQLSESKKLQYLFSREIIFSRQLDCTFQLNILRFTKNLMIFNLDTFFIQDLATSAQQLTGQNARLQQISEAKQREYTVWKQRKDEEERQRKELEAKRKRDDDEVRKQKERELEGV